MSFKTWFLTACAIGSGYLAFVKWSNDAVDETVKMAERIGVTTPPEIKTKTSLSYQLGRSIAKFATYSNAAQNAKTMNGDVPPDMRKIYESNQAEANSQLKSLNIDIDFRSLDYSAPTESHEHSSGVKALAKLIRTNHGERAERAFKLGLMLEEVFWQAQFKKFDLPGSGVQFGDGDAFLALRVLNKEAQGFGAEGIAENDLDGNDKDSLNRRLQHLVLRLDSQLQLAL